MALFETINTHNNGFHEKRGFRSATRPKLAPDLVFSGYDARSLAVAFERKVGSKPQWAKQFRFKK